MSKYGPIENSYGQPISEALVSRPEFRMWILEQTEFADHAASARLLNEEMKARRSKSSQTWWRSHYSEKCRCDGCSGKETDLLVIFETQNAFRFAVHFEIKRPGDSFKKHEFQAAGYPLRAACWIERPPAKVLPHQAASTALLFSESDVDSHRMHFAPFKSLISFELLQSVFPELLPK